MRRDDISDYGGFIGSSSLVSQLPSMVSVWSMDQSAESVEAQNLCTHSQAWALRFARLTELVVQTLRHLAVMVTPHRRGNSTLIVSPARILSNE